MSKRLPPIPGEWIDRAHRIEFTFEGQRFWGYAGDTISSALWAAGQRVLGRSFKYHRPRGILTLANHDVNALMQDGQQPNVRADVTPIAPGIKLSAVNTVGGVNGDRASVIDLFSPFLPVGFYYKAFLHKRQFPFWERIIRRMTGLGKVDPATPRIRTAKRYDFCDVLIVGAGVSGMTAALTAAGAGADVVLVDENARAGGSANYQLGGERNESTELLKVEGHPNIRLYTNTEAAGFYADRWVPLIRSDYMIKMRARAVVIATGAYEQPAVFRNNDLPGIMLASAAQRLIYRYAVKPMERAIVLTANSDGYRAALDLIAHGITVVAVVDMRDSLLAPLDKGGWGDLIGAVKEQGIPVYFGHCVYEARANSNKDGVSAASVCPIDDQGEPQTRFCQTIACDGIVMSVGWSPAANLLYGAGTKMRFDDRVQQFVPDLLPEGVFACGRVNGIYECDRKFWDGQRAGLEAVEFLELKTLTPYPSPNQERGANLDNVSPASAWEEAGKGSEFPSHPYPFVPHPQGKEFVDFDEDLQYKDFLNAVQEGFDNIELLKRYTTVGMSPSQGKHSNMNALRILAKLKGKTPDEIGTTTARPFVHPVPLSHLAGRSFTPERETPLHDRHAALGAKFMLAGHWRRPEYYALGSREACIRQEVEAVRSRVGIVDVGTLGKLEVRGADAASFLERVYTGKYTGMKPGTTRYALMVDETGVVLDDGVIARLAPDHFYFTTTTANSTTIYRELTRLNTLWQLDCGLTNLTGARAAVNLAGPRSRSVLSQLVDLDLSAVAFPYLAVREGKVAGIPAILMRVGFVGEWGYEIHVAAEYAPALWDALMQAGASYGIRPFGVEAQRRLRLEKGHLIVGQDTDGLTTPFDAGLEWAVKLDKPFFVGQRSLQILAERSPKQKLVGFVLDAAFNDTPPQECHLVIHQNDIAGRVTSVGFSPTLQQHIGLAYLRTDLIAPGNPFSIRLSDGKLVRAIVCSTPFYDRENLRQKEVGSEEWRVESEGVKREEMKQVKRTSLIQSQLQKIDAGWETIASMSTIVKVKSRNLESTSLSIADVSPLTRFSVKGTGAITWLKEQGVTIPDTPNTWSYLSEGGVISRLGLNEFLIEDSTHSVVAPRLADACQTPPAKVYPVLRQDLAIALYGSAVNDLLLQTCNINFRLLNLVDRPVILTYMIGVAVIIIPSHQNGLPFYRIWCDGTYGNYFWKTLVEIVQELDGGVAGRSDFINTASNAASIDTQHLAL